MRRVLALGALGLALTGGTAFLLLHERPEPLAVPAPPPLAAAARAQAAPLEAPEARVPEKTREERRFARADRDDSGAVEQAEYLAARRRNFEKLDANGDGRLGFDEYAGKAIEKFAGADKDRSGSLSPAEFATTAAPRRTTRRCDCPSAGAAEAE